MAELPLAQGIDRFKQNEDRMDRFTNGSDTQTFVTSGGQNVPTIRKFLKDLGVEIGTNVESLLEQKNAEINEAAEGILAQSSDARDTAKKWANEAVDTVVEDDEFSSKHYAIKAFESQQVSAEIKESVEGSEQAVNSLRNEASDFRDQAAAYADFARNNWAIAAFGNGSGEEDDIPLLVDPGSVNNMFVVVGGVGQLVTQNAYSLVYDSGEAFIRINIPLDTPYEVKVGNAVDVGVPPDGSVTTPKIAENAITTAKVVDNTVTLAKIQDIPTASIIGRKSNGVGDPEVLTVAELQTLLGLTPVIVDRAYAEYALSSPISTAIPLDDTLPQVGEGTQILSVSITPKSSTNRLRARVFLTGTTSSGSQAWIGAIFSDASPNALVARYVTIDAANFQREVNMEEEWVPGSTATRTVSVRVGPSAGTTLYMNGNSAGRFLGGASKCTLVVEEIEA